MYSEGDRVKIDRIQSLNEFIKMEAFDEDAKVPETLIGAFVDKIIFDKEMFSSSI